MSKNGNGEGSIYPHKRDGKKVGYRGSYTIYTAAAPKRRYVSGKTRKETRQKLAKAMSDRDGGLVFDAGSLTVGEHVTRWLQGSAKGAVRVSTFERYEQINRLHIVPTLGRLKLKPLTPAHVRNLYRDRLDSGLAPATIHKLHTCLHKALAQAVADSLIPRNVTDSLKLPRIDREEIDPLTAGEANRLIDAVGGNRLEALYVLAIHTGLRQGELLALKWEDLDLEAGTLRVRRTLTRTKGTYSLGEPKTKKSRRTVRLTTGAVAALRGHLERQLEEIDRLGSLYRPGGLVFAN